MTALVILDRDGVINHDCTDHIRHPDQWIPIENSLKGIALLNQHGFKVCLATNQSGIARGYFSQDLFHQICAKMHRLCQEAHAHIDHVFYCPHGPEDQCVCRKPKAGLFSQISEHYQCALNLQVPYVGDSLRDLQAGQTAKCQPILVLTGNGQKTLRQLPNSLSKTPHFKDLYHFAQMWIHSKQPQSQSS